MEIADVARVALALDGVTESRPGGLRRWSVHGRLVARQLDEDTIVIRSGFAEREELLERYPETFSVSPRFESHMMVLARFDVGDPEAVAEAIRSAHELQSP